MTTPSIAQAEEYVTTSQINAANGMAGLNGNKQVIVNGVILPKPEINGTVTTTKNISFATGSQDGNNQTVYMFYNPYNSAKTRELSDSELARIGKDKLLNQDTFYFTNLRYGNKFAFDGSVNVSDMISAKTIKLSLSTPSSSSAACTAGEFKDDINYHYVCVANNKWKRVALSDF
ncbi:unnamed protein product [Commensalibacter communis]|uniref:hypothetical protein n=1 Tax=Commensalibacter communis TaxID=2972786 RepID=UPI0022FF8708|nr:hypothetical protein [Commensalibacter communis]CAI3954339.1 unnamed protein product [Commensalibacter communis]CAI3955096.1 unnamed protein product [Commensalibacter communis]